MKMKLSVLPARLADMTLTLAIFGRGFVVPTPVYLYGGKTGRSTLSRLSCRYQRLRDAVTVTRVTCVSSPSYTTYKQEHTATVRGCHEM